MSKEDTLYVIEKAGYRTRPDKFKKFSPADDELSRIRMENNIIFAGEVAGSQAGLKHTENGAPYLVTRSPNLIPPIQGDWSTIKTLGSRLFGDAAFEYVLGWSSSAIKALYNDQAKRGQVLVLAGPPGCGKSFWQLRVITPMLGGRMAKPIQYMLGSTTFNEDIIQSEHLMLEDESSKTDIKSRRAFGQSMKNFVANMTQRSHPKGASGFTVMTSHWMTMSVNDETENLSILPPIDVSLADKIFLCRCKSAINEEWPNRASDSEGFMEEIKNQLPAFIHYLLNEHVIRPEIADYRYGAKSWHDPELLSAINALSPEAELECMIETQFKEHMLQKKKIEHTAAEIQLQLEQHPDLKRRAEKLLYYNTACAVYLERLHQKYPERYIKPSPTKSQKIWAIDWSK